MSSRRLMMDAGPAIPSPANANSKCAVVAGSGVQRKASRPEADWLTPTTTEPSALTPLAKLPTPPPGRSPRGVRLAAAKYHLLDIGIAGGNRFAEPLHRAIGLRGGTPATLGGGRPFQCLEDVAEKVPFPARFCGNDRRMSAQAPR